MAQRLPVPRINTGPQALRYRQRRLKLPVYTTTNPATASLTDTFDTLDAAKWANWGAASVSNGLLSCVPSNAYNGGISSIGDYDLTGSTVSVQVISPCGPGASTENWIQVSSDSNQAFRHALLIKGNQHYSDDFNRADGALGAGWTTQSTPAPVIYNNQMVAPQAGSWAGANINQWTNTTDHKATVVVGDMVAGDSKIELMVRQGAGSVQMSWQDGQAPVIAQNPGFTVRATGSATSFVTGDTIVFSASGSLYTLTQNGTTVLTWDDVTGLYSYTGASNGCGVGLQTNGATNCGLDSFVFEDLYLTLTGTTTTPWAGTTWVGSSANFDPVNHRFLRMREAGGTVYYETSPNASTWNTLSSTPAVFSTSTSYVQLYAGYWGAESSPGTLVLDNLNLAPSWPNPNVSVRPTGRKTGPMALRQRIKRRPRAIYPYAHNDIFADSSLQVTAAPSGDQVVGIGAASSLAATATPTAAVVQGTTTDSALSVTFAPTANETETITAYAGLTLTASPTVTAELTVSIFEENVNQTAAAVPPTALGCYVLGIGGGGTGNYTGGGGGARFDRTWISAASLGSTYTVTRGLGVYHNSGTASVFSSGSITLTAGGGIRGDAGGAGGTATASGITAAGLHNGKAGGAPGYFAPGTPGGDDSTDNVGAGGGGASYNSTPARGGNSMTRSGTAGNSHATPTAAAPGDGGAGGGGNGADGSGAAPGGLYGGGGGGGATSTGAYWGGIGGDGYILVEWVYLAGAKLSTDTALAVTASPSSVITRWQPMNVTEAITATPTSNATWDLKADVTEAITAAGIAVKSVTYDATGTGANTGAGTAASLSWSHTATAGADVFAFFTRSAGGGNLVSCTYDGAAMSMVGSISVNNDPNTATMWVYRKSNVAAGTKTVVATWTGAAYASANSVSYLNVGGVDALDQSVAYGSALTATETVTGTTDAIILNAQTHYMGGVDTFVSSSGGTQRSQILPSTKYMNLVIQDSTPAVNYSTTGGGTTASTARSNMTWTHTATLAGETVLVWVETNTGEYVTAGTYGGNAMTNLGSVDTQDGVLTLTLLVAYSVAAGASTVSVTKNSAVHSMQGNSVGYANVASVDSFASTTGVGTVASIGVTPSSGQMAVACLLHYYTNPYTSTTGGTTRWNNAGAACQAIFDSPTPDTFTGTEPTAGRNWVGISVILTPVSTLSPTFTSTVTATNTNWGSLSLVISPAKPTATHVKTVELLSMGNGNAATATSMSWTHDIESDANLLIVAINWLSTAWYPTCTVGGLSMTEVPSAPITFAASLGYYGVVTFYYYRNPPAGTQTITYQGSPGAAYMEANSFTFRGAGGLGTCAKSANASTTVSGGPNDFFLNIFGGWINANGGFSGYNQNPLWSNIGSEAALIGYAKGPSATFSITQLYGSYGGYGSTVLPIQPMVDIIADSSLAVTETQPAIRTAATFPAALAITAAPSSAATKNRFADSLLQLGPSTTAKLVRNGVAWESTGAGAAANGGTLTWTHTIGLTANCLIVGVTSNTYLYQIPTATVGSTYLKFLGVLPYTFATNKFTVLWGLMDPPTGTQTITVTGQANYTGGNSVAYSGVGGFSAPTYDSGTGTSISTTINGGVDGGLLLQVMSSDASSAGHIFTNYSQTARVNMRLSAMFGLLIGDNASQPDDNTSVTITANQDSAWAWGSVAITLYPAHSPPTGLCFDAIGGGWGQSTATNWTVDHVASQDAYVFVDISVDRGATLSNVQYGGQAMTLLGSARFTGVSGAQAGIYRYMYGPVSAGHAAITGTFSAAIQTQINSVSYLGVGKTTAIQTTASDSSTPLQAVSCAPGQIILESIGIYGNAMTSPTGGSLLFFYGNTYESLVMSQAIGTAGTSADPVTVGSAASASGQAKNLSYDHDIEADANLILISFVSYVEVPQTVTVGGVEAIQIAYQDPPGNVGGYHVHATVWALQDPPTGTQTIYADIAGNTYSRPLIVESVTYKNVDTWDAPVTNSGTGSSATVSVSVPDVYLDGGRVFNSFVSQSGGIDGTVGAFSNYNQDLLVDNLWNSIRNDAIVGDAAAASTTTFTADIGGTADWSAIAVPLYPMVSGSTTFSTTNIGVNWGAVATVLSGPTSAAQAITASFTADSINHLALDADSSIQITAASSGDSLRNANVDSTQAITAAPSSLTNAAWTAAANQSITANLSAVASYGAVAASTISITATLSALVKWALKANVQLQITPSPTADSVRNANVDSQIQITSGRTSNAIWSLAAAANQQITASPNASEARMAMVDAVLPITVGRLGADTVEFDSVGVGSTGSANGGLTLTWSHTINPLANYVVMGVSILTNGAPTLTAKCGGVTMTLLSSVPTYYPSPGPYSVYLYGLANPPTGTVSMTFQAAGAWDYLAANSASYFNVGTVTEKAIQSITSTTTPSMTIPTTSAGQRIINVWASNSKPASLSFSNATQRSWQPEVDNVNAFLWMGDTPGTGSAITFSATSLTGGWGGIALALQPAPTINVGIGGDVTEAITVSPSSVGVRNAVVNAQLQVAPSTSGDIVVGLHGNAQLQVAPSTSGSAVRNAMVDSTISITSGRTANATWQMYADSTIAIAPSTSSAAVRNAMVDVTQSITATLSSAVKWALKAAVLQQITATPPLSDSSRGQTIGSQQAITVGPTADGSRNQDIDSTQSITVTTPTVIRREQEFATPLSLALTVVTVDALLDNHADAVLTAIFGSTSNAIWALQAAATQTVTVTPTGIASYGATTGASLALTASTLADSIWFATAGADQTITVSPSAFVGRGQGIDSLQTIVVARPSVGSLGQFIDSAQIITTGPLGDISYGATGSALLAVTFAPITSDTLLDNHAESLLAVTANRDANVIWDTTANALLTVTSRRYGTFGRLLNVDAALQVLSRFVGIATGTFGFDAAQTITTAGNAGFVRGQPINATQAITATPAGGIVWHGRIGAPLQITATPLGTAVWNAHANSSLTVTESGLVVVSRGQDIDPALDITVDASGEFTQTMSGDVEQAILALPDTELSLGSTMDSALSLIVTYSADIGEALRGGNFFYFYL